MKAIKKLFGEYQLTWPKLIIFSILCGVYSGLVLIIPVIKETAIKEIGVGYECWFILAIFVISNCHSWKEAMTKTFLFFLISQPLCYLVQMPFVGRNLIAEYYFPWFIKTLLTLPGSVIAYQIKRDDLLGAFILAVAGSFLSLMGVLFAIGSFGRYNFTYLIYGIFLIGMAIVFGIIFCNKKRDRIVYLIIVLLFTTVSGFIMIRNENARGSYEIALPTENEWHIASCSFHNINADIEKDNLVIEYYAYKADGTITLVNEKEEETVIKVNVVNGEVTIETIKGGIE